MASAPADLLTAAEEARRYAYAPYSGFAVGAALLAADGRVFTGVNVENASSPVSLCAERAALAAAVTAGARHFAAIAVAGPAATRTAPCGACRQAPAEFGSSLAVYYTDEGGGFVETSLAVLLPDSFALPAASEVPR